MSTADILSMVSVISYILAGVFLVLAVIFWFVYKIPKVVGDLSGRTARRSIEKMRQKNAAASASQPVVSHPQAAAPKAQTPQPQKKTVGPVVSEPQETGLMAENRAMETPVGQTALLRDDGTELLMDPEGTAPLTAYAPARARRTGGKKMTMLDDIILIHTNEQIV